MSDEKAHELQQLGIRLEWAYPLKTGDAMGEVMAPLFKTPARGERHAGLSPSTTAGQGVVRRPKS